MRAFLPLALMLCIAAPAGAADAPASVESVRAVFELTRPQRVLEIAKAQIKESVDTGIRAGLGDRPLNADQQRTLDEFKSKMVDLIQGQFDWAKFEPSLIDAYTHTFSQKDIDAMLAFYRSDAGKAVLEKIPALTQAMMQNVQAQMRTLAPQLAQLRQEMFAKIKGDASKATPGAP